AADAQLSGSDRRSRADGAGGLSQGAGVGGSARRRGGFGRGDDTVSETSAAASREPAASYLAESISIRSWLLTTDHKPIAILYMVALTFFFVLGGVAAT